ncbi:putative glutaredoxin-C14 isoform X1 [Brachypodium distachyon]|uniref:putative glutaredoxin-C14 isoform X1 n=1 Tax=Brachypodium distachyon TaxID=15368 RepID=UPI000D0DF66C|nr:putative glutaredoxin-C14 isoform X1 [Brachypodium distachyon]|eukprot:XP_024318485.1 putative glutaredoxin-C14 isoform X1 [Brachypodium distachyon]
MDRVMKLASERAVVIFTLSSCCMCHTVSCLFCDLGVNALVHELDNDPRGKEMERALLKLLGKGPPVPVEFGGGKLVGGTSKIMSLHLGAIRLGYGGVSCWQVIKNNLLQ